MANSRTTSHPTHVVLWSNGAVVWKRVKKTKDIANRLRLLGAHVASVEGKTENWYMPRAR